MYKQPTNLDEYQKLSHQNCKATGLGMSGPNRVGMTMCCPFCAAPDWIAGPLMGRQDGYPADEAGYQELMAIGAKCKECGRSAKTVFERDGNTTRFEIVQTAGDDPPAWLAAIFPIRRLPA